MGQFARVMVPVSTIAKDNGENREINGIAFVGLDRELISEQADCKGTLIARLIFLNDKSR